MKKLLMIPGPIEFDEKVLAAMSEPTLSHVSPEFIDIFGEALEMMKKVWMCPEGQPFIMAGTGTLAMDMAASNLVERNDRVLVVSTGYFGDRYADMFDRYGADYRILRAEHGRTVDIETIEKELRTRKYKLLSFTHVDTSTAVKVEPEPIGELGQKYNVITILDGVCSVAGEEIRQQEWGIDVVLTASQKAIGVPPGLALLVASGRAMEKFRKRKSPVGNYYADWTNWLPVMQAYENRKPAYFGTPAVNLVAALNISLQQILKEGLENRFVRHKRTGQAFRSAMNELGLKHIPDEGCAANTLSAPRYPQGVSPAAFLGEAGKEGVVIAGGLHPEIRNEYFRVGHMGKVSAEDVITTVAAIEKALGKCGHRFDAGAGVDRVRQLLA
ncbi:MAG: alanine--glyoxylate aminotransferase family protein [Deltaproteobacteria bacterium]|nr:alanine--glyoxylate aminotransferase family protein [Deltaproteobacteria bacterium]